MDLRDLIASNRLTHRWLSSDFAEESRSLAENETAWRHHYVPEFYLRRWSVDGLVKAVVIDTGQVQRPKSPRSLAFERDLYTLPAIEDSTSFPARWVETHLSRIENTCVSHIEQLSSGVPGPVTDLELKAELSILLGFQIGRTLAARQRALAILQAPDSAKRKLLKLLMPTFTEEQIEAAMRDQLPDHTHGAIRVMLQDVRDIAAGTLLSRQWAVYETQEPLVTCDEPVVSIAGPPHRRDAAAGTGLSAVMLYPLDPFHLLVMLHPELRHRGPFTLEPSEVAEVNREVVAATEKTAFERPLDGVIETFEVPARLRANEVDYDHLDDEQAIRLMLDRATPRNRWVASSNPPGWPVARWYPVGA